MTAYVAFIWTDSREVQGQWRYELVKSRADDWATVTANSRGFEYRKVFHKMSDVVSFSNDLDSPNAKRMVDSFLNYAARSITDFFID